MQKYFKRQIELWGEEKQILLQKKSIAIIGAGGLGSSLALALGSVGIGEVHIIDFDKIEYHNIHRQISFTLEDQNQNKADINAKLLTKKSSFTKTFAYSISFDEWERLNIKVDLLIDATDNLDTRLQIDKYAKKRSIPWIYGSVEAFHGQICFFKKSSFTNAFKTKETIPQGTSTPMVMQIASFQANLALRYLAEFSLKEDILYYTFWNQDGEMMLQKFSLPPV